MGFLKKAKNKITSMTDEVVRVMDVEDEEEKKPKKVLRRKKKVKKAPRSSQRPKGKMLNLMKESKDREAPEIEEFDAPPVSSPIMNETPIISPDSNYEESVFDVDEDFTEEYLQERQRFSDEAQAEYSDITTPEVSSDGVREDILQLLQIKPDIELPSNIVTVEDVEGTHFTHQAPIGYDFGEVDTFRENILISLRLYYNILQSRNEDIATLATTVDKLQVDLNNMKFDLQVANGMSIMPTSDADQMENELIDERVKNRKLQERIDQLEAQGAQPETISDEATEFINSLQDELAITQKEIDRLKDENYELLSKLQYAEEQAVPETVVQQESKFFEVDQVDDEGFAEIVLPGQEGSNDQGEGEWGVVGETPQMVVESPSIQEAAQPDLPKPSLPEPEKFSQESFFDLDRPSAQTLPNLNFEEADEIQLPENPYLDEGEDEIVREVPEPGGEDDELDALLSSWGEED